MGRDDGGRRNDADLKPYSGRMTSTNRKLFLRARYTGLIYAWHRTITATVSRPALVFYNPANSRDVRGLLGSFDSRELVWPGINVQYLRFRRSPASDESFFQESPLSKRARRYKAVEDGCGGTRVNVPFYVTSKLRHIVGKCLAVLPVHPSIETATTQPVARKRALKTARRHPRRR